MSRRLCFYKERYEIFTKIEWYVDLGKKGIKLNHLLNICESDLKNGKTSIKVLNDVRSAYLNPEALKYSADFVSTL